MKFLTEYIEEKQSALFKELGVFFAFSNRQFDEAAVKGVTYVSMGMGMISPKEHVKELIEGLDTIHKEGMAEDLKDNGREGIIIRELYNHEAFYTCDTRSTFEAVEAYGITAQEVIQAFYKEAPNARSD